MSTRRLQTWYIGNANEVNPYGSVGYKVTGYNDVGGQKVPTFTKMHHADPAQQRLLDQQIKSVRR